ncbi:hypothetical protein HPHPP4D_1138 [Helicobacter pylori Hp P-4d]|uniref:Uncharacterized protein n=2 Tax=Helicobacter pylori TaxID=210 RepID=I9WEL3_HELPX|nr:hypothetical protein [Helicobacter pylori]EJC04427.1 hypothetical protein HPHPP4_0904 [Helicobacter pylori Hp P-4]EJC23257.1 hypothetical protein HPHPP4D_1138 [Helicobacter pylori Hp P-4d]EJC24994.1 hypothetical protein HPHPP4C_0948 [Helicobacter pylori Hp P-4c]
MTKKFMSWMVVIGALICVLLGVFIFFTSMSVKKSLTAYLNAYLDQHPHIKGMGIAGAPFECEGFFKIACVSKELRFLDPQNSPIMDFKDLNIKLHSLDKSSLILSVHSQIQSPILEQDIQQKIHQIPLKNLNVLLEKFKPTRLNCSLKFNALDEKTLNDNLKCDLTNAENILAYTFFQEGLMEAQENLSLKNIFKTLSSKDAKAIEELQDKLRFLAPKLSVSIQAHHFKNVLESFYQQNKESLGFFSPYFSLRSQTPSVSYESALASLENYFMALFQSHFKDDTALQQNFKGLLQAFVSMAKDKRSQIALNAQAKDNTKLTFNALLDSLSVNFFQSYKISHE